MKILIENDGTSDVTVESVSKAKAKQIKEWEGHCCGECRFYHRHYAPLKDTGAFIATNDGHCYPPRAYSYLKIHPFNTQACICFKPIEI